MRSKVSLQLIARRLQRILQLAQRTGRFGSSSSQLEIAARQSFIQLSCRTIIFSPAAAVHP